jgi:radical SAM protein with 4Fe4S-binding SPASM domain
VRDVPEAQTTGDPPPRSPRRDVTVSLLADVSLKRLEAPYLYHRGNDDLYEVSEEAFSFIERHRGRLPCAEMDEEFLETCLREGLVTWSQTPPRAAFRVGSGERPSLRYLLVHLTGRCNLRCSHCYAADLADRDLPFVALADALAEFERGGGLRLMLSGGEPLLHPDFWRLDELLPGLDVRAVLLTNGTLLTPELARRLHVHEVQVSLDGMEESHDALRGAGAFEAATRGLATVREAGLQVSVASTVNALNLGDFERLAALVEALDAWQWTIDVPCPAGRMARRPELEAPPAEAAAILGHGFASGTHGDDFDYLCGAHLAAVMPDGRVGKCGLLPDEGGGHLDNGLIASWRRITHRTTASLGTVCRSCRFLAECRGGCRYRAGGASSLAPDPIQCYRYGVLPNDGRRWCRS